MAKVLLSYILNSDMTKLLSKIIGLLFIISILCAFMIKAPIKYKHNLAAISNRFDMMSSRNSKKIVFVGGSGLALGVNSETISNELGYDVINLGYYAGYGINFLLEKSKQYLNPGDIVIIIPEFGLFLVNETLWPTDKDTYKWLFITDNYIAIRNLYLQGNNYKLILRDLSELFRDRVDTFAFALRNKSFSKIFGYGWIDNKNFNKYGDLIKDGSPKANYNNFLDHGIVYASNSLKNSVVDELNNYGNYFIKKGITVYFMYSCFPQEEYVLNKYQFSQIDIQLRKSLNFEILGTQSSFILPSQHFSNTANHLTKSGKELRTKIMVEILKRNLSPDVTTKVTMH